MSYGKIIFQGSILKTLSLGLEALIEFFMIPFLKYIHYGFFPAVKIFNRLRLKVNRVDRSVANES